MRVTKAPLQGEVWLVALDPTHGVEISKTRPCLVVSPDEMNRPLGTVIVAPLTTTIRAYPTRVGVTFARKQGQIALDQIRTVDKSRFIKSLGKVPSGALTAALAALVEMFTAVE